MIIKRKFTALSFPKDSKERKFLNENAETSEYMPSYKWARIGKNFSFCYKTKKEAIVDEFIVDEFKENGII